MKNQHQTTRSERIKYQTFLESPEGQALTEPHKQPPGKLPPFEEVAIPPMLLADSLHLPHIVVDKLVEMGCFETLTVPSTFRGEQSTPYIWASSALAFIESPQFAATVRRALLAVQRDIADRHP